MARIGYARVGSAGQDDQGQIDRLARDGCAYIRAEKVTGAAREGRGELGAVLDFIREEDDLVVVRLDRLAKSTRDTLNIAAELKAKGAPVRHDDFHTVVSDVFHPALRLSRQLPARSIEAFN